MLSSWSSSWSSRQDAVFATALQFPGIPTPVPTASASARAVVGSGDGFPLFDRMKTIELTSVSTGRSEYLTNRWRNEELLPIRNQKCVIEFLRHFGWVFCWERTVQLQRDVYPALQKNNIPLIVVGIGSVESGRTFADQLNFPSDLLFFDTTEQTRAYETIATRNSQRDPETGKQIFEGIESMWSPATTGALEDRGTDDLDSIVGKPLLFQPGPYKPLMPATIEATLVQGASFVFDGKTTILEHYDESSGAHVTIEELLDAALS